jgi:hypothetical protein
MRAGANQENPGRHDRISGAETKQEQDTIQRRCKMDSNRKAHYKFALIVFLALTLCGCALFKTPFKEVAGQSGVNTLIGDTVFNRVAFRTWEGNSIWFTNLYHNGILIPAGTECTIKDISKKAITFVANGTEYSLREWVTSASPQDIRLFFDKFFAEDKDRIGLDRVNQDFKESVSSGVDEIGMTKEEILLSLGYPAYLARKDATNDDSREFILSQNDWFYLKARMNKILFIFKGDKLYKIVD